jgi:hypothetical protein
MPADPKDAFPKPNWILEINHVRCSIYMGPSGTEGGLNEANPTEGRTASVVFQCYWDDRLDLIAGLIGTVDYFSGRIERKEPFSYPVAMRDTQSGKIFPNRLVCTSISSVVGTKWQTDDDGSFTGVVGWGGYVFALITAEFTCPPYLVKPLTDPLAPTDPAFNDLVYQVYTISKVRVSGEVFSPPVGSFQFAEGKFAGQPLLDVGASQIRTRFEVSVTRVRMPLIPTETASPLLGTVNDSDFLVGGQKFPKGTMLFSGINPEPRSDPYNGGLIFDVEFTWLANAPASTTDDPLDWNFFLDPGGVWTKVEVKPTADGQPGKPVFKYADQTVLFNATIS